MIRHHVPILATLVLVLGPSVAMAHKMIVEAAIKPEALTVVRVEAYFEDDTPATDAVVKVRDDSGQEIAKGKTDDRGVWTFPRPKAGTYTIRVEDSTGHDQEVVLPIPEDPVTVEAATWQPNLILGVAVGLGLLLGIAFLSWRRKQRVRTM